MSRRPEGFDPRRLQGIPRVNWAQKPTTSNVDDALDAIDLASGYGLIPDPWQIDILHSWMRRRRDGKWVHKTCGLAVPRQNGKNGALEVLELFCLIYLGEYILHTAHQIKTSRKAFKRLKHFFGEKRDDPNAKFPELNALVADVRNTNGQEAIVLKDVWLVDGIEVRSIGRPEGADSDLPYQRGGLIEFGTRTGGGGRGTTYDRLIIDEAQHLSEEDLAAVRPTISSGALGNSQIIYLGTPPDPEKLSAGFGEAWTRIRGNAGKVKNLCWIEYGAPDGPRPDLEDLALLYQCNPSLDVRHGNGSHGLDFETIEGERTELDADAYARERLGWWGNPEAKSHRGVIDMDQWRALRVAGDKLPARGVIVVDVAPDLAWSTVAIATDGPDEKPLGLVDRHEGTGWVIKRVKQVHHDLDKTLEVALTPTAKLFAAALTEAGIAFKQLTSADVGASCMAVQQMITDGELAHVGQGDLDQAARSAITRISNETQQWDRRDRKIDISPLVAFSVAIHRWSLLVAVKPKKVAPPRRLNRPPTAAPTVVASRTAPPAAATTRRPARDGGFSPRDSGF